MPAPSWLVGCAGGDAVVHHQATGSEQARDLAEVRTHVARCPTCSNIPTEAILSKGSSSSSAVVAQLHAHPAGEALLLDQLLHVRVLVFRQRDAGRRRRNARRPTKGARPSRRRCPGSDRPGCSMSLRQMWSSLASWACASVMAGVAEIGARVNAPRVEPQRVEIIRHVVVELDLLRILGRRMRAARPGRRSSWLHQLWVDFAPDCRGAVLPHVHQVAHRALDLQLCLRRSPRRSAPSWRRAELGEGRPVGEGQRDARAGPAHLPAIGQLEGHGNRQGEQAATRSSASGLARSLASDLACNHSCQHAQSRQPTLSESP